MKIVKSDSLSTEWAARFVIVDEQTGNVLDDAQGYGYTSAAKAHKAWAYKTNRKTRATVKHKKRWWKNHPDFEDECAEIMFRAAKDEQQGCPHTEDEIYETCAERAKEMGITDFSKDLL